MMCSFTYNIIFLSYRRTTEHLNLNATPPPLPSFVPAEKLLVSHLLFAPAPLALQIMTMGSKNPLTMILLLQPCLKNFLLLYLQLHLVNLSLVYVHGHFSGSPFVVLQYPETMLLEILLSLFL